jgi:hypothetical protein
MTLIGLAGRPFAVAHNSCPLRNSTTFNGCNVNALRPRAIIRPRPVGGPSRPGSLRHAPREEQMQQAMGAVSS